MEVTRTFLRPTRTTASERINDSRDGEGDCLFPFALRLENQFDDFADRAIATANGSDVMRGAFYFRDSVADSDGEAGALQDGKIGEVVAHVSDFFVGDARAKENRLV